MDGHQTAPARAVLGSLSPGGYGWKYTAPVQGSAAQALVAAFNGGFQFPSTDGGYFSEGEMVFPLRTGAASLVIYKNGAAKIGEWGRDARMTPNVVAVRQNLNLLVDHGRAVAGLDPNDIWTWGPRWEVPPLHRHVGASGLSPAPTLGTVPPRESR